MDVVTWKCAILTALLQVTCLSYWTSMSYVGIAADLVRSVASVRSTLVRRSSTGSSQYSQGQNRDTVTLTTIKETVTAQTPVGSSHYATINSLTKQSTLWPQDYELVSWGNTKHAFFCKPWFVREIFKHVSVNLTTNNTTACQKRAFLLFKV